MQRYRWSLCSVLLTFAQILEFFIVKKANKKEKRKKKNKRLGTKKKKNRKEKPFVVFHQPLLFRV